jgi:hypothetical protein
VGRDRVGRRRCHPFDAVCEWLGSWLPERSSAVDALLVVALAVAGAVLDATRVPTIKRQVNEDWLNRYRGWVYGLGFGSQLGFGVVTVVSSAATYVAFALAVLTGSVAAGAAIGFTFGALRGLSLLLVRDIDSPDALRTFHRRLDARAAGGARLGVVSQALVGVLAVIVLVGHA